VRAQEWWLARLNAPQAWRTSEGAGITVAVLSTGVSATQADLTGDVITGPDYTASGRYAGGPYWGVVGTAVASIIAGHGHGNGNNSGIIGIAPQSKILSVRVTLEYNDPLNATTAITGRLPSAIADGIMYAVNHGAKVVDLPLDAGTFGLAGDAAAAGGSPAEQSAVRYAIEKGVMLVAPAGDNGSQPGQASYPAAYPGVVAVGATGRDGQLASFSSRGSYVSLTAPGVDLMAAAMLPSESFGYAPGYAPISTTSAASAMVAGVAALVMSKYPALPVADVVRALRTGTVAGSEVNAAGALSVAAALSPRGTVTAQPTAAAQAPVARHTMAPARPAALSRAGSGMLASTVLRDAVLSVCGLIVIVAAIVLVTRTRRMRTTGVSSGAGPAGRGLHEQRRGKPVAPGALADASPAGVPLTRGSLGGPLGGGPLAHGPLARGPLTGRSLAGGSLADLPMTGASVAGGSLSVDSLAASSLAAGWPTAAGWQGTGPDEVAHGPDVPRPPRLEPVPKSMRSRSAETGPASPPWAPAPEPGGRGGPGRPVPVMPSSWFPADPALRVRLPSAIPEAPRTPEGFEGPDLTAPFAGRDVLSQSGFGLVAAPVPADYPALGSLSAPTEAFPAVADAEPESDQPDDPA
jgi:hypothetical protein